MSEQNNTAIAQAAYEAFGRGDIPTLLSHVAPDVQWEYPGTKALPFAGSFRGHQGAVTFFANLAEVVEILSFTPTRFFASGDQVVAIGHEQVRMKRNGVVFEQHWAHLFTFADGKVTGWRQYGNSAGVVEAITA